MNKFYVYIHRRASDNKIFYVGKGSGKRAWTISKRNLYWLNTVKKHGYSVEIVFDGLTEEESLQCEIDTILEMKYFGEPLTNMTDGGEGVSGYKPTEEVRLKIAIASTGRIKSEETRVKLSNANKGKILTAEHKAKLSAAKKGKTPHNVDKTIHSFVNENLGVHEECTRSALCEKYSLCRDDIKKLFLKNPRKTSKGWRLSND